MSVIEFIGFLISFAAFVFLMFKRVMDDARGKTQQTGTRSEKTQEDKLKDFLRALEGDMEEIIPPPQPVKKKPKATKPPAAPQVALPTPKPYESIEKRFSGNTMVSSHYQELANTTPSEVTIQAKPSRGHTLLSLLKSKKDMVILNEIIGRPRSYRI